jgi:hypothetical protein
MKRDLYGELLGNVLNRGAPPGHFAAYIRPDESNVLRSMGGGVAPDGGQNMYNGMPAYFSGISAVSGNGGGGVSFGYGDGGVSIPSYSVDAPSVSAPDQGFIDQMNAAVADARAEAAAEEMALADILAGVQESMGGRSAPAGIPASMIGGATPDGVAVGSGRVSQLPQGATSTPFGLMYTSPTAEAEAARDAANKSEEGFRGFLPGELQVVQDPLTGLVTTERSGVVADVVKGGLLSALLGPVGTGIGLGMQAGKAPDVPITFATEAFNDGSSNFQDFSMDDVSVPSTDEIDEMVAALTPTDPTDPTGDPATPAPDPSSQYATVAPDILARILANEQYGRRRAGLT